MVGTTLRSPAPSAKENLTGEGRWAYFKCAHQSGHTAGGSANTARTEGKNGKVELLDQVE